MSRVANLMAAALAALVVACGEPTTTRDADVIVVGAGIAGLAAAIEASRGGARVLVVEANSVGGGHAVVAAGFALVGTPLQEAKGLVDTPERAFADLMAWGETNDPEWTRDYVEKSRTEVHDFLAELGVEFRVLIPTPEHSVPRFHFTAGTAVNAVVPMLRAVLEHPQIGIAFNTKAVDLVVDRSGVRGVVVENTRTGERRAVTASAVVLATGGFQSNLEKVMAHWPEDVPKPERLLIGSSPFALGNGFELAETAGASFARLDRQVTYVTGIVDPRDKTGTRALLAGNEDSIWVNADGRRFVDETASEKETIPAVLAQRPANYWMIFDAEGRKRFTVRDARWLTRDVIDAEIVRNGDITRTAATIESLAEATQLPLDALRQTIERFNGFAAAGADRDFGRQDLTPVAAPPFYAVRLYPFTRKNMGGVAIDKSGRALDATGAPVPGLFAAGELTGVVGINGSHGMSGTFLGPSLYTGRIAGRGVLADLVRIEGGLSASEETAPPRPAILWQMREPGAPGAGEDRAGYWHYSKAHALVAERKLDCTSCHGPDFAMAPLQSVDARLAQTRVCTMCH